MYWPPVIQPPGGGSVSLSAANTWTATQTINLNAAAAPTPAAGTILQVVGVDATIARVEADAFSAIAAFSIRRAEGTGAAPTALTSGIQIGAFNAHGYYVTGGPGWSGPQASLQALTTQAWTSTNQGTKLTLSTTPNNSTTLTTAVTIDQDQSVTMAGRLFVVANFFVGQAVASTTQFYFSDSAGSASKGGIYGISDGVFRLADAAGSSFGRLQFGGTTSSFPSLKRSTTILQARLADDSAFASLQGLLRTAANAVAETITPDHTLVITDASGQAYRVPCQV